MVLRSDFHDLSTVRVTAKFAWRRAWFIHAGCLRSINFVDKKCSMNFQWLSVLCAASLDYCHWKFLTRNFKLEI